MRMGILFCIEASHPAITIQKFMILPPDSIERFSSLCRPQLLLHPNRSVNYILMTVAMIPQCLLFYCVPFETTSSTPKQQKIKAGIEHKNGHLPIKFPLKKEMIPQISLQPTLQSYSCNLRWGWCSWLLFICHCIASLTHSKWGLAVWCSWPQIHPTNHPTHFLWQSAACWLLFCPHMFLLLQVPFVSANWE